MHSTFSCNRETMANPKRVYSNADDFTSLETFIAPFNAQGRTESAALLIWFLQTIYRLDEVDAEDAVCDKGGDEGYDYKSSFKSQTDVHALRDEILKAYEKDINIKRAKAFALPK
jgi:hypothetical protein